MKTFNIGICAIIKDCNEVYLKEWVEYHQLIGVDYFFIYDNDSKIPIQSFFDSEKIIIKKFSGRNNSQMLAYQDCIDNYKKGKLPNCKWIAFIDDDEFIVPECGNIKSVLKDYEKYAGVVINWKMYGSSGLKNKTSEKQILKFNKVFNSLKYATIFSARENLIKTIVQPSCVRKVGRNPHFLKYYYRFIAKTLITFKADFIVKYFFPKSVAVDIDKNIVFECAVTKKIIHKKCG